MMFLLNVVNRIPMEKVKIIPKTVIKMIRLFFFVIRTIQNIVQFALSTIKSGDVSDGQSYNHRKESSIC